MRSSNACRQSSSPASARNSASGCRAGGRSERRGQDGVPAHLEARTDELVLVANRAVDGVDAEGDVPGVGERGGEELEALVHLAGSDRVGEQHEVPPPVRGIPRRPRHEMAVVVLDRALAEGEDHDVGSEPERGDIHRPSVPIEAPARRDDAPAPAMIPFLAGVPEWPKGAGCKPAGSAFRGSNPLPCICGAGGATKDTASPRTGQNPATYRASRRQGRRDRRAHARPGNSRSAGARSTETRHGRPVSRDRRTRVRYTGRWQTASMLWPSGSRTYAP